MRYLEKRYLEKRYKKRLIHDSLLCLALLSLMVGSYLIIDNSIKLARGYGSNHENASSNITDEVTNKAPESPNQTFVSKGLALYDMKPFLHSLQQMKPKFLNPHQKAPALYETRPELGDEIGELYIPKLDAVLPIFEGTSEDELELGVGHYADSVLPGENDNSVLAGHRDTVFRRLGEVGVGDSLIVRVLGKEFEYKIEKVRIVDKEDRTVIVPRPIATLTVSTCYPFSYIGAAPKRYVLIGYLIQ